MIEPRKLGARLLRRCRLPLGKSVRAQNSNEERMLVTEKVFGFLIAAIAVQLVLDGLGQHGLATLIAH